MAKKKITKTIHRIETAKMSEVFKTESKSTLDDLKIKLGGIESIDQLSNIKSNLLIANDDPFYELKKMLLQDNNDIIEEKDIIIEDVFMEYDTTPETDIIEEIIQIETIEANNEKEIIQNIIPQESGLLTVEDEIFEYYYNYVDTYNNNLLIRSVDKRKDEKIIINIALNNLEYDKYNLYTSQPFDIFFKDEKILDFYFFKKNGNKSYNFKQDIYILKNNLIIDSKTYLLEDIRIVNITLNN